MFGFVYQYDDKTGELVQSYDSIKHASEVTGLHSKQILNCILKKRLKVGGFHWSCIKYERYLVLQRKDPVYRYNITSKHLDCYSSVTDAAKDVNTNKGRIIRLCRGIEHSNDGYLWYYKSDIICLFEGIHDP